MEVRLKQSESGNQHHRSAVVAVAFFVALSATHRGNAQSWDIQAHGAGQTITHSLANEVQAFAPVRWDVQNASPGDGCLVEWTAQKFSHKQYPAYKADCELSLRMVRATRSSRWRVSTPIDSSNVSAGKESATVAITSRRDGNAEVELAIQFRNPNVMNLAAGSYQTIITGTISGL